MARRAELIGLCLYGLVACVDLTYHLTWGARGAGWPIRYSELPVAFSAALCWPVDDASGDAMSTLEAQSAQGWRWASTPVPRGSEAAGFHSAAGWPLSSSGRYSKCIVS